MRNAFAADVLRLAERDPRVVLLTGDIGNRLFDEFKSRYPSRFYNCGVAEANMIGVAAGLALAGLRPFAYTIASFATIRCLEQIKIDVGYHGLPVIVVGTGSGLAYAENGATHIACDDVACLRTIPGLSVYAPADPVELSMCLDDAFEAGAPSYVRIGKKGEPRVHREAPAGRVRSGIWLQAQGDVCILSTGVMLPTALEAARRLADAGLPCAVCSCPVVKPLPVEALASAFERFRVVATVEEHGLIGGFGSAVAEWLADRGCAGVRLVRCGVSEVFPHRATTQEEARARAGLDAEVMARRIAACLEPPRGSAAAEVTRGA